MSIMDGQGAPTWTAPWPPPAAPAQLAAPSRPIVLVLRVLLAVGLVMGMATLAAQPVGRDVDELLARIAAGDVGQVTIERWAPDVVGEGGLRVDWTEGGRSATATYRYSTLDKQNVVDEGRTIVLAAQRAGVPVTTIDQYPYPEGVTFPAGVWGVAAGLGTLLLLIGGAQPQLATRWAWFWLAVTPVAWVLFLVLEPRPMWAGLPRPVRTRRLTGGWAFLLVVVVLGPLLAALGPEWAFLRGQ